MKIRCLAASTVSLAVLALSGSVYGNDAEPAAETDLAQRELVVAASDASSGLCMSDYELVKQHGNTVPPDDVIQIVEQNGDTVVFKVKQFWDRNGVDNLYVDYKSAEQGSMTCEAYSGVQMLTDMTFTAKCHALEPEAIVDIFVVDDSVSGNVDVPACCHGGTPPSGKTVSYTFVLQCTPTCIHPLDDDDRTCPEEFHLDFNQLPDYSYVYDEYYKTMGVSISAKANTNDNSKKYTPRPKSEFPVGSDWKLRYGFTENDSNPFDNSQWENLHTDNWGALRVFNTQYPDGNRGNPKCSGKDGDEDLGSPNENCPVGTPGLRPGVGPGHGDGGDPNHRNNRGWSNCPSEMIGNVLVIQELRKSCPDDTWKGGWMNFDFDESVLGKVQITHVQILDTDDSSSKTPEIRVWKSNENLNNNPSTPMYKTPRTGDGGLWEKRFDTDSTWKNRFKNVKRFQVYHHGSGSISGIRFRTTKCPPFV